MTDYPDRKTWTRALLLLLLLEAVSFGLHLRKLGFYADDWVWLESFHDKLDYLSRLRGLLHENVMGPRTFANVVLPLWYTVAGAKPLFYQASLLGFDLLGGFLFYLFLWRAGAGAGLSLIAAALSLIFPGHPATHFWFSDAPQTMSQCMLWIALLMQMEYLESPKLRWLFAGVSVYFLSLLCYESDVLYPVMLCSAVYSQRRSLGQAVKAVAPFGLTALAGIFWQRVLYRSLFHTAQGKSWSISIPFILKTYWDGLATLSYGTLNLCSQALSLSLRALGAGWLLFIVGFAALSAGLLLAASGEKERRPARLLLPLLCGSAYVAAYAPYALSGNYEISMMGIMSRTNGGGGLAAALLLALLLDEVRARWTPKAEFGLLTAILLAFTCTNWLIASKWAGAWSVEQAVLAKLAPQAARLPEHSIVGLDGVPDYVGGTDVFNTHWSFSSALRLASGNKALEGESISAPTLNLPETEPIKNLYLYHFPQDRLYAIGSEPPRSWYVALKQASQLASSLDQDFADQRAAPDSPRVLSNLCADLAGLDRLDEAEADCARAISLAPHEKVPYFNEGLLLMKRGRAKEAADRFRTALKIDPGFTQARDYLRQLQGAPKAPALK